MNYIFNSSIKGIEDSDLIFLIGCNPRHEATMLNARIRKAYVKNKVEIYSIGDAKDLTYPYKIVGENTEELRKIFDGKHEISSKVKSAKKPLFIVGESILELKSSGYILENLNNFCIDNNFISDNWNAFNILVQNASTVAAIEMRMFTKEFSFFNKLDLGEFKLLYLLGSDNLNFKKTNEFIIYQGSHGDRGAEIADIILPSPAYTEQNGIFINLEGRPQDCVAGSYPTGEAKEDWLIFNLIHQKLKNKKLFSNFKSLRESSLAEIKNFNGMNNLPKKEKGKKMSFKNEFQKEKIEIREIDYYFSNAISRASKTMSDCRSIQKNKLLEGTNY